MQNDAQWSNEKTDRFAVVGASMLLLGIPLVIVGAVLTGKGNMGRIKMGRLMAEGKQAAASGRNRFAGVSPHLSADGTSGGAALLFQF